MQAASPATRTARAPKSGSARVPAVAKAAGRPKRPRGPRACAQDVKHPIAAQRSAVTNGSKLFAEARPGNSAFARRFRDVLAEIISDLGGPDRLSEGQRQLARRCALIAVECEKMEGDAAAGNEIDLDCFGQLTDRLGRTFQRLGLKRKARDVTPPSVTDYLAHVTKVGAGEIEAGEAE